MFSIFYKSREPPIDSSNIKQPFLSTLFSKMPISITNKTIDICETKKIVPEPIIQFSQNDAIPESVALTTIENSNYYNNLIKEIRNYKILTKTDIILLKRLPKDNLIEIIVIYNAHVKAMKEYLENSSKN